VKYWGNWVLEEAKKEIAKFYPPEPDGSIPVGYYWMRIIPCQNPVCGTKIPLTSNFWLAKKNNKKIALKPYIKDSKVEFDIVGQNEPFPKDFNPENGTIARAVATCPVCGAVVDDKTTRKLFQEGKSGQRMIAVVLHHPQKQGKTYRIATEKDMQVFKEAEEYLKEKRERLRMEWGMDPVPDEEINYLKDRTDELYSTRCLKYGIVRWGDLFNSRQKLALITFTQKVRLAYKKMMEEGYDEEYAKAVVSYLAMGVDRLADYNSTLCIWHVTKDIMAHTFGRQALPMTWDYIEVNPFSNSTGNWEESFNYVRRVLQHSSHT